MQKQAPTHTTVDLSMQPWYNVCGRRRLEQYFCELRTIYIKGLFVLACIYAGNVVLISYILYLNNMQNELEHSKIHKST